MPSPRGYAIETIKINGAAWGDPSEPWNVQDYGTVEVQFNGIPTTPYQPQRSLDGVNWHNCPATDPWGNTVNTISQPQIYSFDGEGHLRFSAGAGSTLVRRAAA